MRTKYAVGVDFGTESARALLVDVATGAEIAVAEARYPHGVIDEVFPPTEERLPPGWALQDPEDYLVVLWDTVAQVVREAAVSPKLIIGVGVDFTACTMLPVQHDGTPLSVVPSLRDSPHAWVKLWKHHAAQSYADEINGLATTRGEQFLGRYGGKLSSEWFFPKVLETLREAPEVYSAADRFIEAQDWVVWQLIGKEARSLAAAGYKAAYDGESGGYPSHDFLQAIDPRLSDVVSERMAGGLHPPGARVGGLTDEAAARTGLLPGTSVATANLDAVVSVAACGVTTPGRLVMVMGTSVCDLVLGTDLRQVEGMCGVVRDAVVPGSWVYETGQSCVGDMFAWFVRSCVPASYEQAAAEQGMGIFDYLEMLASHVAPGESGLVALDWWNGNRSILVDADVSGLIVGTTLATRPEELYLALLESTAFGKRVIIETLEANGVPVDEIVACGGLPDRSPLLMQIHADVTGREIWLAESTQVPALGAALHAAVAAGTSHGGYNSIAEAAASMSRLRPTVYRPRPEAARIYDRVYREFVELHDHFGKHGTDLMRRLKSLRAEVRLTQPSVSN